MGVELNLLAVINLFKISESVRTVVGTCPEMLMEAVLQTEALRQDKVQSIFQKAANYCLIPFQN